MSNLMPPGAGKPRPDAHPRSLTAQLRRHIVDNDLTAYAVSQLTIPFGELRPKVAPSMIARFLKGERSISLETADYLALALNLSLVQVAARGPRRKAVGRRTRNTD